MGKITVLARWNVLPQEEALVRSCWPTEAEVNYARPGDADAIPPTALRNLNVLVGHVSEELVANAPSLRLIHVLGHGIEQTLRPGVRELLLARKIPVAKANPGGVAIAEFALMAMLALTRRVFKFHEALAYGGSRNELLRAERMNGGIGGELFQSTLGIVGFGNIGRELALRTRALGMKIGAVSRYPERIDRKQYGVEFTAPLADIDSFLGRCDYVVLCLPLTSATRDLMNRERFAAMKVGSYFVNMARGGLVIEEALHDALRSGKLAGAALDVSRWEVSDEFGGYPFPFPLHQYNVILTPHYAGSTLEARRRALHTVGENLRRLIGSEPLLNLANLEAGY
ncbi:MAG: NAD(P)-binding domain-containing protein [Candidatus Hydrogenedentes bacterium]|nr:NAD(P)-binding domain-containing protein [Candidatus Hydrogenedentota bacterium]